MTCRLSGISAAFFIVKASRVRRQPADFSIEGPTLIVLDKEKRELWRKDTKMEDLLTEDFYRRNFQVMHKDEGNILPALVIRDINGDGDTKVLFAPKRVSDQTEEGFLYCYDRKGVELWSFHGGRELRCGGKVFSPDYRIAGFHVHDLDGDGRENRERSRRGLSGRPAQRHPLLERLGMVRGAGEEPLGFIPHFFERFRTARRANLTQS